MTSTATRWFDDLLCVEVNLSVTDVQRGTAFDEPTARRAVLEEYRSWLVERSGPLNEAWQAFRTGDDAVGHLAEALAVRSAVVEGDAFVERLEPSSTDTGSGGPDPAAVRRDAELGQAMCRTLVAADAWADAAATGVVMRRIAGMTGELAALTERGGRATTDEVRITRKAWELGTATILLQTVVQLDGDVVVRVGDGAFGPDRDGLVPLHDQAVANAIAHWQALVDFFVQITIGSAGMVAVTTGFLRSPGAAIRRLLRSRRGTIARSGVRWLDLVRPAQVTATWRSFAELRRELLDDGGKVIDSGAGAGVYARTVIQADGDGLWFVTPAAAADPAQLRAHADQVATWAAGSGAVVAALRRYVRGAQLGASGAVGAAGAWLTIATSAWIGVATAAAVAAAGPLSRRCIGWGIRRAVGAPLS